MNDVNHVARAAFGAGAMGLMAVGGMAAEPSEPGGDTNSLGAALGVAGGLALGGGLIFDMALAVERSPSVLMGAGGAAAAVLLLYAGSQ